MTWGPWLRVSCSGHVETSRERRRWRVWDYSTTTALGPRGSNVDELYSHAQRQLALAGDKQRLGRFVPADEEAACYVLGKGRLPCTTSSFSLSLLLLLSCNWSNLAWFCAAFHMHHRKPNVCVYTTMPRVFISGIRQNTRLPCVPIKTPGENWALGKESLCCALSPCHTEKNTIQHTAYKTHSIKSNTCHACTSAVFSFKRTFALCRVYNGDTRQSLYSPSVSLQLTAKLLTWRD